MTDDPGAMTTAQLAELPWETLRSSNVGEVAYQPDEQVLYVRFAPDSVYRYEDVPADDHAALLEASADQYGSVGRVFHARVKRSRPYRRIRIEDPDE